MLRPPTMTARTWPVWPVCVLSVAFTFTGKRMCTFYTIHVTKYNDNLWKVLKTSGGREVLPDINVPVALDSVQSFLLYLLCILTYFILLTLTAHKTNQYRTYSDCPHDPTSMPPEMDTNYAPKVE